MTELVAAVRVVLAVVFVFSAVAKLRDREGSREAVAGFGVPGPLVGVVATGLPFAELACALLLLLPDPAATTGAVASLVLLGAFTAAVVVNLLRDNRIECHCFGSVGDSGAIGWHTVARNGAFLLLAAVSLVGAGSQPSVPGAVADMSAVVAALWFVGLLALGVIVAMGLVIQQLVTRYGALLLRLEAVEQATGLAEPGEMPLFTLPDLEGDTVSLEEKLADGLPAMVVFVSPSCANCTELLPDLAAWQRDEHGPHIVVLSDGTVEDNRAKLEGVEHPLQVLLQKDRSVIEELGIKGTPAAVLVGVDGLVAGAPVYGQGPIVDLIASTHDTLLGPDAHDEDALPVHQIMGRPLGPGDEVPELALSDETGAPVTAQEAFAEDGAVAVFWRYDCGFCLGILDDVKALEATTPVRIVTSSTVEEIRAQGLTSPILRDGDNLLGNWLEVPGTPSAARLRGDRLDSGVGIGGPQVLGLLRSDQRDTALVD